ncbi:SCAN domain-containing protein 3-like [Penaeus monodon]|uniref:SCAN domain-containing protein 3-like n=1 Tax=Penaeus monodon TaxID=6687 RepID=UPI0018A6FDAC|nr:SCAN domain-containing protein 3-like [Penaeus monodon]
MVYQDNLTKFCILRPLQTKRTAEVAFQLVDIFLLMDAPAVLQSDNGSEFTSRVITEVKEIYQVSPWFMGRPQSQGSVERANGNIKDMLVTWLADNNSQDWSVGINFRGQQHSENAAQHSGIKCSPYSATFGCEARVGLTFSPLPTEVVSRLEREDDRIAVMSGDDKTTTGSAASSTGPVTTSEATTSDNDNDLLTTEKRRVEAYRGQVTQAERMVKRSRLDFKVGEPGDNIAVPILAVDRGRGDPRNILGVIVSIDLDYDQYNISVKSGVLKGQNSKNQFDLYPQHLAKYDVNQDTAVSLREAVIAQSACAGQGFTRCNCSGQRNVQLPNVRDLKLKQNVTLGAMEVSTVLINADC